MAQPDSTPGAERATYEISPAEYRLVCMFRWLLPRLEQVIFATIAGIMTGLILWAWGILQ